MTIQDRAFLGLSTLRDLIIKKPQGTNDFLEALLDVTTSDLELVSDLLSEQRVKIILFIGSCTSSTYF